MFVNGFMKKRSEKLKIYFNKKLLYVIIILVIILIVLIILLRQQSLYVECSVDSDCIKQQTTCCSCESGGEEVCVAEKDASEYAPKDCPKGINLCAAVYSCLIDSCKCVNNKCVTEYIEWKKLLFLL